MRQDLVEAFRAQSDSCRGLGSPFMARLMETLPGVLGCAPRLAALYDSWPGDPGSAAQSLPLRLAGGLHALVLAGEERALAACYPPVLMAGLAVALEDVLARRDDFLCDWVRSPPQTNEVGRSAALIPAALALSDHFGLPLKLSELGASAGLNLRFDHYRLRAGSAIRGPDEGVTLAPDWRGLPPGAGPITVVERRGVDLKPVDPARDGDRLMAYLWPDQPERMARLEGALRIAARVEAVVDRGDAANWLDERLAQPMQGACHMVFHTVAHQYFPRATQDRIAERMAAAGQMATRAAPLAWVGMEADAVPGGAGLTLRLWPGDRRVPLGRAGFHGQWIDWKGFAAQ